MNLTLGVLGDVVLVSDQDNRLALLVERFEDVHDFLTGGGVQVSGGFVSQEEGWFIHQSPGHGDPLPLPATELRRLVGDLLQSRTDRLDDLESRLMAKFGLEFWKLNYNNLDYLENRLINCARSFLRQKQNRLDLEMEKLAGLDPYGPLRRGYSMVTVEKTGKFLRSVNDVQTNDDLEIAVMDGTVRARSL
ncbi:MAG: exodeoxyribonuclease VII large subunit [Longimicrobiales bacterium]